MAAITLATGMSWGGLTPSEVAQVRDEYTKGTVNLANHIRTLLGRTDLAPGEAGQVFTRASDGVPFDDKREQLLSEVLWGVASPTTRSPIFAALSEGLLVRAVHLASNGHADESPAVREALAIHQFILRTLIRDEAEKKVILAGDRKTALDAYKLYLNSPAVQNTQSAQAELVRAQGQLVALRLSENVLMPHEVAPYLGLGPVASKLLAKTGWVVVPETAARIDRVLLEKFPSPSKGVLWVGKARVPVAAEGGVLLQALVDPESREPLPAWFRNPAPPALSGEVSLAFARWAASRVADEPGFADAALALSKTLEKDTPLSQWLQGSILRTDAGLDELSSVDLLARAVQLLLLDGPAALDAAYEHAKAGQPAWFDLLTLGVGVLRTASPTPSMGDSIGDARWYALDAIQGSTTHIVAFRTNKLQYVLTRGANGRVTKVERIGGSAKSSRAKTK